MGPVLPSDPSSIVRTNRAPRSWLCPDTVLKSPLSKCETPTSITEQHTHSVPCSYIDRNIKTITCLEAGVGSAVKHCQGCVQPVPLDISPQTVQWGPSGRGTISQHPERQREVWGMGHCHQWFRLPWSAAFHTVLARFPTWACPACGSWGTPAAHSSCTSQLSLWQAQCIPRAHTRVLKCIYCGWNSGGVLENRSVQVYKAQTCFG